MSLNPAPTPWDAMDSLFDAARIAQEVGISEETFVTQARCAYRDLSEYEDQVRARDEESEVET